MQQFSIEIPPKPLVAKKAHRLLTSFIPGCLIAIGVLVVLSVFLYGQKIDSWSWYLRVSIGGFLDIAALIGIVTFFWYDRKYKKRGRYGFVAWLFFATALVTKLIMFAPPVSPERPSVEIFHPILLIIVICASGFACWLLMQSFCVEFIDYRKQRIYFKKTVLISVDIVDGGLMFSMVFQPEIVDKLPDWMIGLILFFASVQFFLPAINIHNAALTVGETPDVPNKAWKRWLRGRYFYFTYYLAANIPQLTIRIVLLAWFGLYEGEVAGAIWKNAIFIWYEIYHLTCLYGDA